MWSGSKLAVNEPLKEQGENERHMNDIYVRPGANGAIVSTDVHRYERNMNKGDPLPRSKSRGCVSCAGHAQISIEGAQGARRRV
jgi:hypothetical protein